MATNSINTLHDLDQTVGSDLSASSTGDLMTATGTQRSQQRVLRRLLTSPGDYVFHPAYGAGLPKMIGNITDVARIRALIRAQLRTEASVAHHPEPSIDIRPLADGVAVSIQYVDATQQQPVSLSFTVQP
ncbi:conserved hypothetical protein [Candidatus Glomeribacter gigasporarum BEG34]|uniref:Phage tail protein n=1 Tax=Candidatus Glomeribacter gigasporarum BEG34 TaxID=1070319 RepID=G2JAZ1_9BURK|nr:hypothetical protein [Candidatus Glomeribacter gigasporarum]CCD29943.1 conserved hypothetical protein [Candidatus Glomeribacter gigasporarum BEG34]